VRLRPERPNHVWAYDFVEDRTRDGRKLRMLNVVDESTRECLAIRVSHKLGAADVIDVLSDLFILRGTPKHVRSDKGPEFAATAVRDWITGVGARAAFIEPGSPWENGYVESFNGKLRDELLDAEVFNTLAEAKVLIEGWRKPYNTVRPHSSLRPRARGASAAQRAATDRSRTLRISPSHWRASLKTCPDHPMGAGQKRPREIPRRSDDDRFQQCPDGIDRLETVTHWWRGLRRV